MAANLNTIDCDAAAMEDSSNRRSFRLIKRKNSNDELVESNLGATFGSPSPKTQRAHSLNTTSISLGALENLIPLPLMSALEDQNISILNNEQDVTTIIPEHFPTYDECEELVQFVLNEETYPMFEQHVSLISKESKKEMVVLEYELPRAQVEELAMTGFNLVEFDSLTLAVLHGQLVRYLMRSNEITIGRSSKYLKFDVDLKFEGPTLKISRQQATIRMCPSGDFIIACEGEKCLYVDGKPLAAGSTSHLNHNSVVEISGLRFIFLINHQLINTILEETFLQNQLQLPIQIVNQTQQKQQGNQELQMTTVTKAEKRVLSVEQQQQKMLKEHRKQKLENQQKNILENQRPIISQQQIDEMDQQLKNMKSELEKLKQQLQNFINR